MQSLEEIRRRQDEATQLNQELDDTNRGVVALYAELDERAEQLRRAERDEVAVPVQHEPRIPHAAELDPGAVAAAARPHRRRTDTGAGTQVGYIRSSAESLLELVNDLLDLAKVEAGKVEVKPATFTVQDLFGALRGTLRPLLTSPCGRADLRAPATTCPTRHRRGQARADPAQLHLQRAEVHRSTARCASRHATTPSDKLVMFTVRDTGIGIAPRTRRRSSRSSRRSTAACRKRVKGTGLGLPLSRKLAELIGGVIRVESVVGQGSMFTLAIPAALTSGIVVQPADLSRKRVLVIDDDDTFRYILTQIIANEPRYDVIEANNGGDGLRRARDERPDVIVLDLQMPNIDGFTVLQELSADQRTSVIPVIVSTSLSVNAELRARLPMGTRLISKNMISRENVSLFLRDAVSSQAPV